MPEIVGPVHQAGIRPAVGLALSLALALAGCAAVGPDFRPPAPPAAQPGAAYTPTPLPPQTVAPGGRAGSAQRFTPGGDIPAQWWGVFHSDALDQLIRATLERSPNLASAQAALRQAQEVYNAQSGTLRYPSVGGQLGVTRETAGPGSGLPPGTVYNLYNASVSVSYTIDVFGGTRRTLEGLQAAVDYQRYQVEATYLALTANLVTSAIREASLRAQLQATREMLEAQQHQLAIIEQQYAAGAVARQAVLAQRTQAAQTRTLLAPLEKALDLSRHQLAVYAGRLPSEPGLPEFHLESLHLPDDLPVSLPTSLVRHRPDIRASEALLHQASAQVGVATANLYPQFTLTGDAGSAARTTGALFGAGSGFWSLAAALTQPLFNGGALDARRRAALASFDQAAAQYRATVLAAFQNVADALRTLESDADALKAQAETETLSGESLALAERQYRLGATSYLALLDAQRAHLQARIGLVQAQSARYADSAALFQALGGGWWNREPLKDISKATHD